MSRLFVLPHEAAVAEDIGTEYSGELAVHGLTPVAYHSARRRWLSNRAKPDRERVDHILGCRLHRAGSQRNLGQVVQIAVCNAAETARLRAVRSSTHTTGLGARVIWNRNVGRVKLWASSGRESELTFVSPDATVSRVRASSALQDSIRL